MESPARRNQTSSQDVLTFPTQVLADQEFAPQSLHGFVDHKPLVELQLWRETPLTQGDDTKGESR